MNKIEHLSVEERRRSGRRPRAARPSAHAGWEPAADRPDPVALLEQQNATREADLVPVRHGRMMVSPFTFYRGAAKIMAADLKDTPTAGLNGPALRRRGSVELRGVRVAGASTGVRPERLRRDTAGAVRVRREAHGGELHDRGAEQRLHRRAGAGRDARGRRGVSGGDGRVRRDAHDGHLVRTPVGRRTTRCARGDDQFLQGADKKAAKTAEKNARKNAQKAHTRDSLQALSKLAEQVDGQYRIVSQPPVVVPARDLARAAACPPTSSTDAIHQQFRAYRATLQDDRRHLLERFEVVDVARKVVGVGSVGTRAFIVLLQGRDQQDPLFLQVKEATASVLEDHLPKSRYQQPGERVVQGQRMMQAASDIYLGWTKGVEANRYLYWRQLRDMKGSAVVETMAPITLAMYARFCGETLARAHARSGDPIALAAYLGTKDKFDQSIADFSHRYADQNEQDYQAFCDAIRSGRLEALEGV